MSEEFTAERRQEAGEILKYLSLSTGKKPFAGTFCMPGMPFMLAQTDPAYTGKAFAKGLSAACAWAGAETAGLSPLIEQDTKIALDTIQVIAAVTDLLADETNPNTTIEAVAEVMRCLLVGAIIAAKDGHEGLVKTFFRAHPRFELFPDFETNTVFVAGRMRAAVYRDGEPEKSYLLGGGQMLDYKLPDAGMFAGANRLRFLDLRSPGHLVEEQLVRVA